MNFNEMEHLPVTGNEIVAVMTDLYKWKTPRPDKVKY